MAAILPRPKCASHLVRICQHYYIDPMVHKAAVYKTWFQNITDRGFCVSRFYHRAFLHFSVVGVLFTSIYVCIFSFSLMGIPPQYVVYTKCHFCIILHKTLCLQNWFLLTHWGRDKWQSFYRQQFVTHFLESKFILIQFSVIAAICMYSLNYFVRQLRLTSGSKLKVLLVVHDSPGRLISSFHQATVLYLISWSLLTDLLLNTLLLTLVTDLI